MKLNSLFDYYCLSSPEFGVVSFGGGSGIDKGRKRGGGGGGGNGVWMGVGEVSIGGDGMRTRKQNI